MIKTQKLSLFIAAISLFACGEKGFDLGGISKSPKSEKEILVGQEDNTAKNIEDKKSGQKSSKKNNKSGTEFTGGDLPQFVVKNMKNSFKPSFQGANIVYADKFRTSVSSALDENGNEITTSYGILDFLIPDSDQSLEVVTLMEDTSHAEIFKQSRGWFISRIHKYVLIPSAFVNFIPSLETDANALDAVVESISRIEDAGEARLFVHLKIQGFGSIRKGVLYCQANTLEEGPDFSMCEEKYTIGSSQKVKFLSISSPKDASESSAFRIHEN